jgi:hypothetical protein
LDAEFVREKREKLSGIAKRTKSTSTPRLTLKGVITAVLTLLIPLGLALLSAGLKNTPTPDERLVTYGALLAASPIIALGVFWFAQEVWGISHPAEPESKESLFGLLYKETITDVETTTREDPEPTSVEFEDAFRSILSKVLGSTASRRLVLVIDNLDRVDRDTALSVWSTLQTFLQRESIPRPAWADRVWVIVPHAREGVVRFQPTAEAASGESGVAFLEKSLQITISLPLPVASKWREFFLSQLAVALPNHNEDDLNSVLRVFAMKRAHRDRAPTAREMKTFINEVAALHQIRLHEFPLSHLAYFVLASRGTTPEAVASSLRERVIPSDSDLLLTSRSLTNSVAALLYGTDGKTALQVLLQEPILNALQTPDPGELRELSEAPGFWSAFSSILDENVPSWKANPVALANASRAIEESGILASASVIQRNTTVELVQETVAVTQWQINADVSSGLVSAIKLSPTPEAAAPIIRSFREGYERFQFVGATAEAITTFLQSTLLFVGSVRALQLDPLPAAGFIVPIDLSMALSVGQLLYSRGSDREHWNAFRLADPSAAGTQLGQLVLEGRFVPESEYGLRFIVAMTGTQDWVAFFNAAALRLGPQFTPQAAEAEGILRAVLTIVSTDESARSGLQDSALRTPFEAGYIAHEFAQTPIESEAFAISIAASLVVRREPLPASHAGNSGLWQQNLLQAVAAAPTGLLSHLSSIIAKYSLFRDLWLGVRSSPNTRALFLAVAENLSRESVTAGRFPPSEVIPNWAQIRPTKIPANLLASAEWVRAASAYLITQPFDATLADLYLALLNVESDQAVLTHVQAGIDTVAQSTWQADIANHGSLIRLATGSERQGPLSLGLAYRDALIDTMRLIMAGQLNLPPTLNAASLFAPLDDDGRTIIWTASAKNLAAVGGGIAEQFLRQFDAYMPSILGSDPSAPQSILGPWVDARNQPAIAWLAGFLEANSHVRKAFQKASLVDLRDRLRASQGFNPEWDADVNRLLKLMPVARK